jgi:NADPH:quinone reductase-like Zn-dependent oxidoreductase
MSKPTMKAVKSVVGQKLVLHEIEKPSPGQEQILIKVAAAGVNRPDLIQRAGRYPPPPGAPETLGLEVAGTIEAAGSGVARWKAGDKVCALLPGGGYAEYALAHQGSAVLCLQRHLRQRAGGGESVSILQPRDLLFAQSSGVR